LLLSLSLYHHHHQHCSYLLECFCNRPILWRSTFKFIIVIIINWLIVGPVLGRRYSFLFCMMTIRLMMILLLLLLLLIIIIIIIIIIVLHFPNTEVRGSNASQAWLSDMFVLSKFLIFCLKISSQPTSAPKPSK
jgi:hypothetical protein